MADLSDIGSTVARRRGLAYVAMFAVLFFASLYLRDSTWRGDIELHTLMETVATVLALAVGCLALVRFYSKKDNTFLFIGTAFVATAFLDGYHAVISSSGFIQTFPSFAPSHVAWSWFASRVFLALLLWLSWLFWRREGRLGAAGRVSEHLVYGTVTALALALFFIVEFVSLPTSYYQLLPILRPQEFLPALFFLLALIGYLRKGKWKTDLFEHWLVLSLIVAFMGQAMFMSLSGRLYDMMFDAAHLLKSVSYICALVGLLFSMQRLFSESLAQQELAFTNTILATQQEVSPDAILVVDEHEKIISYNRHFVDLWGLTQEMVAARIDEPVLRSVVAQVQEPETFLARVEYLYEHRSEESHEEIDLKDGRIIDRYSAPVLGADGKYYGRIWFFRNITARRHAEHSAMDERIFSDTLISSQPDIFFVLDSKGRFIRWNEKVKDILSLTDTQLAASNALAVIYEADRPAAAQKIQEGFEQGAAYSDVRVITKAGIRDYSIRSTRADTAKGAHLIGIGTDITERKRAEQMMRQSEAQLADAQRIANVGSWEIDHATNTVSWSVTTFSIFEEDISAFSPSYESFLAAVHPGDLVAFETLTQHSLREHTPFDIEHRLLMKDGRIKHVHERGETFYDWQGRPLRTVGTVQDITARILSERQIKLFRTLLDSAPDVIIVVDVTTLLIIDANESACVKLGYTREELLALHLMDITLNDPATHKAVIDRLLKDGNMTFETYHKRKDGVTFPVEVTMRNVTLDRPYSLAIVRDITERKRAEGELLKLQEQLREQAVHDPLTGLYNRRYLDEMMGRELIRAARHGQSIGIVMCDIDHFKVVNDTYGHLAGDEVLRIFAELLKKDARGSDIVCRFGGEEFLLFLPDMASDVAYQRAERLRMSLAAMRITSGTAVIQVTASFGVAAFPENGKTLDALIRAVDAAMYEAKETGRDRVVVSSVHGEEVPDRTGMGGALVSK